MSQKETPSRIEKPLSPREQEVLVGIAKGFTRRQIAQRLGISEGTVRIYTGKLFNKFSVHSGLEAALHGLSHAHIQLEDVVDKSKTELVVFLSPGEKKLLEIMVSDSGKKVKRLISLSYEVFVKELYEQL